MPSSRSIRSTAQSVPHARPKPPPVAPTGFRSGRRSAMDVLARTNGGASRTPTHIKALRATNSNTLTVGAGDLIGASPLVSALFHDEPTIEAMNSPGLDVTGVGNHEFDEGVDELHRMQYANQLGGDGCHPVDGCQDGTPFAGSIFQYLAANVFYAGTNTTILPPYEVHKVGNAKIAFIGLTFEGTPTVVTPSAVEGLEFRPEVATVNALVDKLRREQGVKAFVVLLHQGGAQRPPAPPASPSTTPAGDEYTDVNRCANFNGPAMEAIAQGLDARVRVIISAHTHQPYIRKMAGKLVTSAASFGRLVTDIDLTIDHQSKTVTAATATNRIVTQDVAQDPDAKAILDKYTALAAPLANRVVGSVTADIRSARNNPSGQNAAGEQPMGDAIADAMLEATKPTDFGGAVAAFMNSGGVRARLLFGAVQLPVRGVESDHAALGQRPLPVDHGRRPPGRRRVRVVRRRRHPDRQVLHLSRRRQQLHGRRRRQLHGLPLMHRAAGWRDRRRRVHALPRRAFAARAADPEPNREGALGSAAASAWRPARRSAGRRPAPPGRAARP